MAHPRAIQFFMQVHVKIMSIHTKSDESQTQNWAIMAKNVITAFLGRF